MSQALGVVALSVVLSAAISGGLVASGILTPGASSGDDKNTSLIADGSASSTSTGITQADLTNALKKLETKIDNRQGTLKALETEIAQVRSDLNALKSGAGATPAAATEAATTEAGEGAIDPGSAFRNANFDAAVESWYQDFQRKERERRDAERAEEARQRVAAARERLDTDLVARLKESAAGANLTDGELTSVKDVMLRQFDAIAAYSESIRALDEELRPSREDQRAEMTRLSEEYAAELKRSLGDTKYDAAKETLDRTSFMVRASAQGGGFGNFGGNQQGGNTRRRGGGN